MVLCRRTRSYLLTSDNGRSMVGNSESSARSGLTTPVAVIEFYAAGHACFSSRIKVTSDEIADFERALTSLRFEAGGDDQPRRVFDAGLGFPSEDVPDLTGQTVYSVMRLDFLRDLVDRSSPLKGISLPVNSAPRSVTAFEAAWAELDPDERTFSLAALLGRPIFWFTDRRGAELAESYVGVRGLTRPDAYCETLGLGHLKRGMWLVLLAIPGDAVQKAGHYRPLFCDAIGHRYFMAGTSCPPGRPDPWGQTANLDEVRPGTLDYDGCPERVSRQINPSDFDGAPRISVELLGEVKRHDYPDVAPPILAAGIWARRKVA
jgi:hypothetical protein